MRLWIPALLLLFPVTAMSSDLKIEEHCDYKVRRDFGDDWNSRIAQEHKKKCVRKLQRARDRGEGIPDTPQMDEEEPQQTMPPSRRRPRQPTPIPDSRRPGERDFWYIGFGLFLFGDLLADGDRLLKDVDSKSGLDFEVGITVTNGFLVGLDLGSYAETRGDTSTGVSHFGAAATYFPFGKGPYVKGGLYSGSYSIRVKKSLDPADTETSQANGSAVGIGVGYAFWIGDSFNLLAEYEYKSYQLEKVTNDQTIIPLDISSASNWGIGIGFYWY